VFLELRPENYTLKYILTPCYLKIVEDMSAVLDYKHSFQYKYPNCSNSDQKVTQPVRKVITTGLKLVHGINAQPRGGYM